MFEKVTDVAGKPAAAWEAEGYIWFDSPIKGWYRKIVVKDDIEHQIEESTSVTADSTNDLTEEDDEDKTTKKSTKTIKTDKKEISHKYSVNYEVYDNLIKVK